MSTRRTTHATTQNQQQVDENNLHTSGDEEVEVDPRVLNNLSQEVRDLKIPMASMQANLQLIANQLNPSNLHTCASPRPSRASSRHEYDFEEEEDERINLRQSPRVRRQRRIPPHLKEVKIYLPHFYGKDNVEVFLDWVAKVEQLFESHVMGEERRVSLATLSFQGHALNWWTSLVLQRRRKRAT